MVRTYTYAVVVALVCGASGVSLGSQSPDLRQVPDLMPDQGQGAAIQATIDALGSLEVGKMFYIGSKSSSTQDLVLTMRGFLSSPAARKAIQKGLTALDKTVYELNRGASMSINLLMPLLDNSDLSAQNRCDEFKTVLRVVKVVNEQILAAAANFVEALKASMPEQEKALGMFEFAINKATFITKHFVQYDNSTETSPSEFCYSLQAIQTGYKLQKDGNRNAIQDYSDFESDMDIVVGGIVEPSDFSKAKITMEFITHVYKNILSSTDRRTDEILEMEHSLPFKRDLNRDPRPWVATPHPDGRFGCGCTTVGPFADGL